MFCAALDARPNHPSGGILWEAVWAAADDQYLGHHEKLFDKASDFPFPKWEALWWIAKDHGQSPPHARHSSHHYAKNATPYPPAELARDPHFCHCPRRWPWPSDLEPGEVFYNWPKIQLDLSSPQACAASYYHFYDNHKGHTDPVCFRASIFCAILSQWCSKFDLVIDANKGGKDF